MEQVTEEKELVYNFEFDQSTLHKLCVNLKQHTIILKTYLDFIDSNYVRHRLEDNIMNSIKKSNKNEIYYECADAGDRIIPIIKKIDKEMLTQSISEILLIKKTIVFALPELTIHNKHIVEIKAEQIFMDRLFNQFNGVYGESFVNTLNILTAYCGHDKPTIVVDKNIRVGSDEILTRVRIEAEYTTNYCEVLKKFVNGIQIITNWIDTPQYEISFSFDNVFERIHFRSFCTEPHFASIAYYAPKLDGVRCKGFVSPNCEKELIILSDENQYKRLILENPLFVNMHELVGLQLEQIDDVYWITDILTVFKISYNNKTQYSINLNNPHKISIWDAVTYLNNLHSQKNIKPQKFTTNKITHPNVKTDGFIAIDVNANLYKLKSIVTYELEYVGNSMFTNQNKIMYTTNNLDVTKLRIGFIYECVLVNNKVTQIIKLRSDRLFANTIE